VLKIIDDRWIVVNCGPQATEIVNLVVNCAPLRK
jgi:hypothetical protein